MPSQSGNGPYTVKIGDDTNYPLLVPDYETNACKCKHIWAVEFVQLRELNADDAHHRHGKMTITATKRTTYPQNWPAYNAAQTNEKRQFQTLLYDLCQTVQNAPQGKGRPTLALSDAVFAVVFKIYSTFSGRRFISDLKDAQAKGYITKTPHYNSVFNYLENPAMTQVLTDLIIQSSLPLKAIEVDFAVDSTGFTTSALCAGDHNAGPSGRT